jgi:small GTP-binding protein
MPHVEKPQAEFKVVILGDSHIGKTSLVTRFAEGYYRENSRPATLGGYFVTKTIQSSENVHTKIQIWDTAGADSFRAMAPIFYKTASAIIICYDATRRDTFDGMRLWLDEVRRKVRVGQDVVVAIAALKSDLLTFDDNDGDRGGGGAAKKVAVPEYEVEQLAEALGFIYLPTSAKTGFNVHALFQRVADRVLQYRLMNPRQNGDGDNDGKNNPVKTDGAMRAKISDGSMHHFVCGESNKGSTIFDGIHQTRDQFVGGNNDENDTSNRNEKNDNQSMHEQDPLTPLEKLRRLKPKSGKCNRTNSRSGTPSTTNSTASNFDESGVAHESSVNVTPKESEKPSELLCVTTEFECSSPACVSMESSSYGCTVQ